MWHRIPFMRSAAALIFVAVVLLLGVRAAQLHLADTYLDPIGKVDAQDEAMYASNAIHMAQHGNWMTPMYQGRFALYKPPLLAWLAGISAKLFGTSALALRLSAILAGVLWLWPHVFEATRLWVWDDYTYHMVYPTLWLRQHVIAATPPSSAFTMQAWYPLSASRLR